jgi:hypothetical protein
MSIGGVSQRRSAPSKPEAIDARRPTPAVEAFEGGAPDDLTQTAEATRRALN